MDLKQAIINNMGMQQEVSISKEGKDFAYKNVNIRIQSTGDGTLASVTNLKSPLKIEGEGVISMEGKVLNSIMCGKYIVVFTHSDSDNLQYKDYIYRIDLENNFYVNVLYNGDLNFSYDKPIDSTFYYENDKIQKVYWVDGWTTNGKNNYPRVINIISDGERNGGSFTTYDVSTNFDFYPEIKSIPNVSAEKNFDIPSEIPSGTIQYFVSYFNKNNSETLIASGTFLYTVDLKTKGASPEEKGCAFNITISNVSSDYEYIRLYSVKRTSLDGEAIVSIVKDIRIVDGIQSYSVTDNGIGQETLDPSQILFVGGTPLFARTLCQKDNTLFVGGIKTASILIDNDTKEIIKNSIIENEEGIKEASWLVENYKELNSTNSSIFNSFYPYNLQKDVSTLYNKTFKVGEIYRFGIQFQTANGAWSEALWIGDKKIKNYPTYDIETNTFRVSNIKIGTIPYNFLYNLHNKGFIGYRLLMADTEQSNARSILAQGAVCPTMFSPNLRCNNSPHTFSSWVMRPRQGGAPNHHLEPLNSARFSAGELSTYDPNISVGYMGSYHSMPFEFAMGEEEGEGSVKNSTNFYIDESIIDLYSPELNENVSIGNGAKFRIIGFIPISVNYSNMELSTENLGIDLKYTPGLKESILEDYRVGNVSGYPLEIAKPLYSEYIYEAPACVNPFGQLNIFPAYGDTGTLYNIHMWQHSRSIIGFNINEDKVRINENDSESECIKLDTEPFILKENSFYNHLFSKFSEYFDTPLLYPTNFGISLYKNADNKNIKFENVYQYIYAGSLDYIHSNSKTHIYHGYDKTPILQPARSKVVPASSRITFNSIPHAVLSLGTSNDKLYILPRFKNEPEYNSIFTGKYYILSEWKDITRSSSDIHDTHIKNSFSKSINSPGIKLKVPWIENFVKYREGTTNDIYDNGYKKCCSACIYKSGNIEDSIKSFFVDHHTVLNNYDYKENNEYTLMVLVQDEEGDILKKCTWPFDISQVEEASLPIIIEGSLQIETPLYSNVSYPILWNANSEVSGGGTNYDYFWRNGGTYTQYPFVVSKYEYGEINDRVLGKKYFLRSFEVLSTTDTECIYKQDTIDSYYIYSYRDGDVPYLFIGEIYYDIPYTDLYGGISPENLSKLSWLPISSTVELLGDTGVLFTEGDTYYQRWDCLKTFPLTENDINKVVDITSFMVETHVNLDDRYDSNRANFNMVVRPINFNLFNPAYNQKNNLFSYSTMNELHTEENSHQVTWSLTKNIAGLVDTWTSITSTNIVNLKHPVTKLVNFNNKVVGITDHSVEIINYNAKNLIPTEGNTFIELQNSSKVDGTIDFTINKGSRNMSVLVTEAGLYFIDDNENSLIRVNYDGGIKNIALGKLDSWFKQNIVPGTYTKNNSSAFHLEYDSKYKDVYICNDNIVVVYNETLDSFTSFIDYQELVSLFTDSGKTYAISFDSDSNSNDLYCLYEGDTYGYGFYEKPLPYSIQYRINPGPYSDKVFTNVEFKADLNTTKINSTTSNVKPFNTIQVWNEYQDTGVQPLVYDRLSNLKDKFRTWRAVIPRNRKGDKSTWRDRIRNPWVHLKLDNTDVNGQKLEFHNITVTYME